MVKSPSQATGGKQKNFFFQFLPILDYHLQDSLVAQQEPPPFQFRPLYRRGHDVCERTAFSCRCCCFSLSFFFTPAVVIGARFMAIGRTPAAPFTVARFFADFLCFFSCPPFRKRTGSSRRRPRRAAPYPTHGQIVDDSARVAAGETRRQRSP